MLVVAGVLKRSGLCSSRGFVIFLSSGGSDSSVMHEIHPMLWNVFQAVENGHIKIDVIKYKLRENIG